MKGKGLLALIAEAPKGKSKGADANESDDDTESGPSLDDAAQALLDAIKADDADGVKSALRDAFACCHEEMAGDDEEPASERY
jgi:hypothetical protein